MRHALHGHLAWGCFEELKGRLSETRKRHRPRATTVSVALVGAKYMTVHAMNARFMHSCKTLARRNWRRLMVCSRNLTLAFQGEA